MTTVRIDLPDDQAAALRAKAAASGLSLEAWLQQLAAQQAEPSAERAPKKSAFGLLARYAPGPSDEDIAENRAAMMRGFAEDAP
jgi:plasmid stability protein